MSPGTGLRTGTIVSNAYLLSRSTPMQQPTTGLRLPSRLIRTSYLDLCSFLSQLLKVFLLRSLQIQTLLLRSFLLLHQSILKWLQIQMLLLRSFLLLHQSILRWSQIQTLLLITFLLLHQSILMGLQIQMLARSFLLR